jgi:hypothetical protein
MNFNITAVLYQRSVPHAASMLIAAVLSKFCALIHSHCSCAAQSAITTAFGTTTATLDPAATASAAAAAAAAAAAGAAAAAAGATAFPTAFPTAPETVINTVFSLATAQPSLAATVPNVFSDNRLGADGVLGVDDNGGNCCYKLEYTTMLSALSLQCATTAAMQVLSCQSICCVQYMYSSRLSTGDNDTCAPFSTYTTTTLLTLLYTHDVHLLAHTAARISRGSPQAVHHTLCSR